MMTDRLLDIPGGMAATKATLRVMAELARSAALTRNMRERAISLLQSMYATSLADYIRTLRAYIRDGVLIVDEPDEIITAPGELAAQIDRGTAAGDCDDVATLAAALLRTVGIETRLKAVAKTPQGYFGHVFAEYRFNGGGWTPFDTTIETSPVYDAGDFIVEDV